MLPRARGRTEPKGHTGRPVSPVRGPTEDQRERQVLSEISFKIIKGQSQSCKPGIRLRSVEPGIQERRRRSEALRSAVNATRNQWKGSRFCTRIQLLSKISKTAPKGSVREDIIGQFGDPCPLVTRGNTASKPVRAEFGQRRFRRKDQGSEQQRKANYNKTETERESAGLVLETALDQEAGIGITGDSAHRCERLNYERLVSADWRAENHIAVESLDKRVQ